MDRNEAMEILRPIIMRQMSGVEPDTVIDEMTFTALGASDLEIAEVFMQLEDGLKMHFSDAEIVGVETVGQVIDLMVKHKQTDVW